MKINSNVSLTTETKTEKLVIPSLIQDTLDLVLKIHESKQEYLKEIFKIKPGDNIDNFEMLFNETLIKPIVIEEEEEEEIKPKKKKAKTNKRQ